MLGKQPMILPSVHGLACVAWHAPGLVFKQLPPGTMPPVAHQPLALRFRVSQLCQVPFCTGWASPVASWGSNTNRPWALRSKSVTSLSYAICSAGNSTEGLADVWYVKYDSSAMSASRSEFQPSRPKATPLAVSPTCKRALPKPRGGVPGPTFWKLPPAFVPLSSRNPHPPGLEGDTVITAPWACAAKTASAIVRITVPVKERPANHRPQATTLLATLISNPPTKNSGKREVCPAELRRFCTCQRRRTLSTPNPEAFLLAVESKRGEPLGEPG